MKSPRDDLAPSDHYPPAKPSGEDQRQQLRDRYPRDITKSISVLALMARWNVDREYLEDLACSSDLIPQMDGDPLDIDRLDPKGIFRFLGEREGPGLQAGQWQTGPGTLVVGELVRFHHLPDRASYWLPAVRNWEAQHPCLLTSGDQTQNTAGVKNAPSELRHTAEEPASESVPPDVQAGDQTRDYPLHDWLYETWKEEKQLGGSKFFSRLSQYSGKPGSPIKEHTWGDAKHPGAITWEMDQRSGRLVRSTIQNLVSQFRKRKKDENT